VSTSPRIAASGVDLQRDVGDGCRGAPSPADARQWASRTTATAPREPSGSRGREHSVAPAEVHAHFVAALGVLARRRT
jgi:hypothetical protein